MLINFAKELMDLDGNPLPIPGDQEVMTLAKCSIDALMISYQDEQNLPGEKKLERYVLALAIHNSAGPLEVTVESLTLIKKLIGKAFGPLVSGQVWLMLEGQI